MRIDRPANGPATLVVPWPDARAWRKLATRAAIVLLVLYVAFTVRAIWIPLALAFLIALVLDPVVDRLEARGWTRPAGTAFIFGLFAALVVGCGILLFPHVASQVEDIGATLSQQFPDPSPKGIKESLMRFGVPEGVARPIAHTMNTVHGQYTRYSTRVIDITMQFATNLVWVVIVPIVAFYALRDFHLILAKGLLLVPKRKRDLVQTAVSETTAVFAKYLRGMALVSAMNGIATWLMLLALGTNGSLVLGIVAGVLYSVPYIGAIVTTALIMAISFLQGGFNYMLLVTGLSMLLHQVIFDYVISPKILGGSVGLHPIIIIVALLIGNLLLGIIGMILAVPIAACIQIGVLALVPKLKEEVDLQPSDSEPADSVDELAEEISETHMKADATEELHRSVSEAVDHIEQKIDETSPAKG